MRFAQKDVTAFHILGRQPALEKIDFSRWPGGFRLGLMREELNEIGDAWYEWLHSNDQVRRDLAESEIVDGLVDLLYVTIGSAVAAGVDLDPFWELVQKANMAKVDGSLGPAVFNNAGKILKPPGWKPPDILSLLLQIKEQQK